MHLSCYIIFCTSLNPIFFSFLNFCSIKRSLIILSKKIILAHSNIFLALVKKLEQNKDRALFTYVWAKFVLALQASSSLSLSPVVLRQKPRPAHGGKSASGGGKNTQRPREESNSGLSGHNLEPFHYAASCLVWY